MLLQKTILSIILLGIFYYIFSTGIIIPMNELFALIPIAIIAGATAYAQKDKKLINLFNAILMVGGLMVFSVYHNSTQLMQQINPERFSLMHYSEVFEWTAIYGMGSKSYSFQKIISSTTSASTILNFKNEL